MFTHNNSLPYKYFFFLFFLFSGLLLSHGCSCGISIISPADWGKWHLSTDLPNDTLDFKLLSLHNKKVLTFILFNKGREKLDIVEYRLHDETGAFQISKIPKLPFSVGPEIEKGQKISIIFHPRKEGKFVAKLSFLAPHSENTDENGLFWVTLKGEYLKTKVLFSCGDKLDFGGVIKGSSKTLSCELSNTGPSELRISSIRYHALTGGKNIDFASLTRHFPLILPAFEKAKVEIQIRYSPSDYPPERDAGYFIFMTNLPFLSEEEQPHLEVIGSTLFSTIKVIPLNSSCHDDSICQKLDQSLICETNDILSQKICQTEKGKTPLLTFGNDGAGKVTTSSLLIFADGTMPLKISALRFRLGNKGFEVDKKWRQQLPIVVEPKKQLTLPIHFRSTHHKVAEDALIIETNASENPKRTVLLKAIPRDCHLKVEPESLTFSMPLNPEQRDSQTLIIKNVGDGYCHIDDLSITSSQPFSFGKKPPLPFALQPGAKIGLVIFYQPSSGDRKEFVKIKSNDLLNPEILVPLIPPKHDFCQLLVQPTVLNFLNINNGSAHEQPITLFNLGKKTCRLNDVRIRGTLPAGNRTFSFAQALPKPLVILPNKKIKLFIKAATNYAYSYIKGEVIFSDGTPKGSANVLLIASKKSLCVEVVPKIVDFGGAKTGCTSPVHEVTVYHLGAPTCPPVIRLTTVALKFDTTSEFKFIKPFKPVSISAQKPYSFKMLYKAANLGKDIGYLNIYTNFAPQSLIPVALVGDGVLTDKQRDTFLQVREPLADILFVVDNSGSMAEEQSNLARNFKSFITWALTLNVNYHIGVITTDVRTYNKKAGCLVGTPKFITPKTPNQQSIFARNIRVGIGGSAIEQGFEAAYQALSLPKREQVNCNRGFYRSEASLSLIFVSDEKEQSPRSYDFYLNFFKNLKGVRNTNFVRASAVVGPPPRSCSSRYGSAEPAPRYWNLAKALRGVQASICSNNWGKMVSQLGAISFGYRRRFSLSRKADSHSIIVKVNGKLINESPIDGWVFDPVSNSIFFSKSQTPQAGAMITVDYKAICY